MNPKEKKELKSMLRTNKAQLLELGKQRKELKNEVIRLKSEREKMLTKAKEMGMGVGRKAKAA